MDTFQNAGAPTGPEMAIGLTGLEQPAAPAGVPPAAAPTSQVRWLTDAKRVESYDLLFPFAIGDDEVRKVTVKRLSAREVGAFNAKLRAMPEEAPNPRFPMFFVGDVEISDEAWDAMDDDDRVALAEISDAFLPVRFRR